MLDAAGISGDIFSTPKPSGYIVSEVKKEIANELGLSDKTIVVTGGHDQACAALGAGIINDGEAVNGMGTTDCITTAFSKPVLNKFMLANNFNCEPHVMEDRYISLAFTLSGGSILRWYRDSFIKFAGGKALLSNKNIYSYLDDNASVKPTGIFVLPHFSGSGTPHMDINSKGAIVGLTTETTSGEFYRSLLEGVAYEMKYNIECLAKSGVKIKKLRAVGGGSKSDLWLQIKADVMGMPIETLNVNEAGTLATAILAGKALGIYDSYESALDRFLKVGKIFYPNKQNSMIYEERYDKYKRLYSKVKEVLCNNIKET
jgi:xylulokinase